MNNAPHDPRQPSEQASLADCPGSPNCVSTVASRLARAMPPISFEGSPQAMIDILAQMIAEDRSARIVSRRDLYLHATFTSRWLRFVDDVEFFADPTTRLLHFRSASRTGYWDFGVNRRRMRRITSALMRAIEGVKLG